MKRTLDGMPPVLDLWCSRSTLIRLRLRLRHPASWIGYTLDPTPEETNAQWHRLDIRSTFLFNNQYGSFSSLVLPAHGYHCLAIWHIHGQRINNTVLRQALIFRSLLFRAAYIMYFLFGACVWHQHLAWSNSIATFIVGLTRELIFVAVRKCTSSTFLSSWLTLVLSLSKLDLLLQWQWTLSKTNRCAITTLEWETVVI